MTASQWEMRRSRRRRAWKMAAALVLALLSGLMGCQGTGDPLRRHAANYVPPAVPQDSIPTRNLGPRDTGGNVLTPAVAVEPDGANNGILQIGATKIVPSGGEDTVPPDKEANDAERKWSAAPDADSDPKQSLETKEKGTREKQKNIQNGVYRVSTRLPSPTEGMAIPSIPAMEKVRPFSLAAALAQAGVENPVLNIARQAVQRARGLQMQARVLLLPSVNIGADYENHNGPVQSSFGAIRKVDRQSVYYGFGANTVVAESIKIPGLLINTSLADAWFQPRAARYNVANRRFLATATRNEVFLEVSTTYLALMAAECRLAIIRQTEKDFEEVVRLTKAEAETGAGRDADARRAEADLLKLYYEEQQAQQEVAVAAADLAQLLNLDPSTRLVTGDIPLQVVQFIDPKEPLPRLLEIAQSNHPAILAASANVRARQVHVRLATTRPLIPILVAGFSAGNFGGGTVATTDGTVYNPHTGNSNLAPSFKATGGHSVPKFGKIAGRVDVDVLALWTLQNMGFGNLAHIRQRRAELGQAQAQRLHVINRVREQVSVAYNTSARQFQAIAIQRRRVQEATQGFQRDLERSYGRAAVRAIEVLDNAKRLREGRERLLDAVIGFDRAQFQLFVALGQPPTLVVEDNTPPGPPQLAPPAPPAPEPPANMRPPEQLPPPKMLP